MIVSNDTARPPRLATLAAAVFLALAGSGSAFAQTEKERELEARIAELERVVQTLLQRQRQSEQRIVEQVETRVAETVEARVAEATAAVGDIQSRRITPNANPNTTFGYGGFIKLDAMLTDTPDGEIPDGSVGRLLFLPGGIPVGGLGEGTDIDSHVQFSRFWLSADSTLDSGDRLRGYFELDLFGGALGNEIATNTFGVTVRHAYASWNDWLAGQTWSNFQDVAALPDAVDFIGPTEGTTFVRQAQVRYSRGPWSLSLENPQTIVTPFGGGARIASDDGAMPDFTARYLHKADWGHVTAAALLRNLKLENPATGIDDSTLGYGISLSGKYVFNAANDLRYMLNWGEGINRYLGLAISNDAVLDGDGRLETIGATTGFVAWRHVFSPTLRGNVYYSGAFFDNDTRHTGLNVTRNVQSVAGNLIWSPLPKLDLGVELRLSERELESGDDGRLRRLHFHAKYSF